MVEVLVTAEDPPPRVLAQCLVGALHVPHGQGDDGGPEGVQTAQGLHVRNPSPSVPIRPRGPMAPASRRSIPSPPALRRGTDRIAPGRIAGHTH
jgi:hypothetical protein